MLPYSTHRTTDIPAENRGGRQSAHLAVQSWREYASRIFFSSVPKILVSLHLEEKDRAGSPQNIELEGVIGKIFRNKELVADLAQFIE
jgi:hypothetical protein